MAKPILLLISEEYGYQHWYLTCSPADYIPLLRRWDTMKGLNCLVPVDLIFPDVQPYVPCKSICANDMDLFEIRRAHVHECDDSGIEGSTYRIPDAENFEIEGVTYSREEITAKLDESRAKWAAWWRKNYPEDFAHEATADAPV